MTASRAFRPGCYVAQGTRARILEVAKRLDYTPDARLAELMNQIRRGRRPRFTGTLALLKGCTEEWPVLPDTLPNRRIFGQIVRKAEDLGYSVFEHNLPFDGSLDRLIHRILRARNIRGLILIPPPGADLVLPFDLGNYSSIVLGNAIRSPAIHRVMGNERNAVRRALAEIASRGYRKPGLVMHRLAHAYSQGAWLPEFLAYQHSLPKNRSVPPCIYGEWTPGMPADLAKWLRKEKPDVLLSADMDVYRWLRREKWRIPDDIAYVCLAGEAFDDTEKVSGTLQNFSAMGSLLVEQLVGFLQRGDAGVPALVVDCFVEASWREGTTLPGLARSRRTCRAPAA